jgi:hypothetical protein
MSDLEFIRQQQEQCADQLRAKHPERAGLQMAISDWIAEEAILDAEAQRRREKTDAAYRHYKEPRDRTDLSGYLPRL